MTTQDAIDRDWQEREALSAEIDCPDCGEEIDGLADKIEDGEYIHEDDRECSACHEEEG